MQRISSSGKALHHHRRSFELSEDDAQSLAGDIGRLESLVRRLHAREITNERDAQQLKDVIFQEIRQLIESRELLLRYTDEQIPHDSQLSFELVLERARADVAAYHASRELSRKREDHKDEMIVTTTKFIDKLPQTIILSIGVPLLLGFAASYWQVKSFKDQEVFKTNYAELRGLVSNLTDIQISASELQSTTATRLQKASSKDAGALIPLEKTKKLLRRFDKTVQAFRFEDGSDARFAELRANYELQALRLCLGLTKNSGWSPANLKQATTDMHAQIDEQVDEKYLTEEQGEEIKTEAIIGELSADEQRVTNRDCGGNFDPDTFRQLTHEASNLQWSYEGGNPFKNK